MSKKQEETSHNSAINEEKARKYVEFYYFWKFHYCVRNYWSEIDKLISGGKKKIVLSTSDKQEKTIRKIYYSHPLSRMEPKFPDIGVSYTDLDELVFEDDGATFKKPHHLLSILCADREIDKSFVSDDQPGGISILGTNGAYVDQNGALRGKIIAEIDLSAPLPSISYELSRLQAAKFVKFPDFMDGPEELTEFFGDYQILADIIKNQTDSAFSVKDDPARAIGLWFWDMLSGPDSIFESFSELWTLITTQDQERFLVEPYLPSEMLNIPKSQSSLFFAASPADATDTIKVIPTLQVFSKLGYAASDPAVFRRLYRNTQKCIEACEVLSLK